MVVVFFVIIIPTLVLDFDFDSTWTLTWTRVWQKRMTVSLPDDILQTRPVVSDRI